MNRAHRAKKETLDRKDPKEIKETRGLKAPRVRPGRKDLLARRELMDSLEPMVKMDWMARRVQTAVASGPSLATTTGPGP